MDTNFGFSSSSNRLLKNIAIVHTKKGKIISFTGKAFLKKAETKIEPANKETQRLRSEIIFICITHLLNHN